MRLISMGILGHFGWDAQIWDRACVGSWLYLNAWRSPMKLYTLVIFTVHWTSHTHNQFNGCQQQDSSDSLILSCIRMYCLYIVGVFAGDRSWWNCFKGVQYVWLKPFVLICWDQDSTNINEFQELRHRVDRFSDDGTGCHPPRWHWRNAVPLTTSINFIKSVGFPMFPSVSIGSFWTDRDPYLVKLLFALTPRPVPCSHGVFALPMTWRGLGPLKLKSNQVV